VFKKATKVNGEIVEVDIINKFGFTLQDNILDWGENFAQNHPNYIFEKLEHAFYKYFRTMNNNEEIYMQLQNIQKTVECVKV
jgi:hypothetical protein